MSYKVNIKKNSPPSPVAQFTNGYKGLEIAESHDRSCPESTWHIEQTDIIRIPGT